MPNDPDNVAALTAEIVSLVGRDMCRRNGLTELFEVPSCGCEEGNLLKETSRAFSLPR